MIISITLIHPPSESPQSQNQKNHSSDNWGNWSKVSENPIPISWNLHFRDSVKQKNYEGRAQVRPFFMKGSK